MWGGRWRGRENRQSRKQFLKDSLSGSHKDWILVLSQISLDENKQFNVTTSVFPSTKDGNKNYLIGYLSVIH